LPVIISLPKNNGRTETPEKTGKTCEAIRAGLKKIKMVTKKLVVLVALIGIGFCANAQIGGQKTTQAVPISNGCGSEEVSLKGAVSTFGANYGIKQVDAVITGTSLSQQNASCDQHDKDYYNQVGRQKADNDFQQRSPVMGTAVKAGGSASSYNAAANDKPQSERLQPTWEKENQQSLDASNYKVVPRK
jgi:hypothetical protein